MATAKSEVIHARVTARDAEMLRSIAALEDVTLSSVAGRALRDFTTRLTANAVEPGAARAEATS